MTTAGSDRGDNEMFLSFLLRFLSYPSTSENGPDGSTRAMAHSTIVQAPSYCRSSWVEIRQEVDFSMYFPHASVRFRHHASHLVFTVRQHGRAGVSVMSLSMPSACVALLTLMMKGLTSVHAALMMGWPLTRRSCQKRA